MGWNRWPAVVVALCALCVAAGLAAAASAQTDERPARLLTYAHTGPEYGADADALRWFDRTLRERSGNALGLEIAWDGERLDRHTAMVGLAAGQVDMATVSAFAARGFWISYEIVDAVTVSDEWVGLAAAQTFMTHNGPALAETRQAGVQYLASFSTGPLQLLMGSRPVVSEADLAEVILTLDNRYVSAFATSGAIGVDVPREERLERLMKREIDGVMAPYHDILQGRLNGAARYLTEFDFGQRLSSAIAVGERTFATLTPMDQRVLRDVALAFTAHQARALIEAREAAKAAITEGSPTPAIEIFEPEPALREVLTKRADVIVQEWLDKATAKGLPAEAMLEDYRAAVAAREAERDSQGYPWTRSGQ